MKVPFRKIWIAAIPCALLVVGYGSQCTNNNSIFVAMIITTIFLSAWSTQYAMAAGERPGRWIEYLFSLMYDIGFLLAIATLFSVLSLNHECLSDRSIVARTFGSISTLKFEIEKNLLANKPILAYELEYPLNFKHVVYLEVQKEGRILVVTENPSASIRLIPERSGNTINWKCRGSPKMLVPSHCSQPVKPTTR